MAVPSKYIQSVVKAAKGRPKSTDWYRDKIREFGTPKTLPKLNLGIMLFLVLDIVCDFFFCFYS